MLVRHELSLSRCSGNSGEEGDHGATWRKIHFWTAAKIQCAAGGLGMGLRCISGLPPVFSVPPVDSEWVLDAFLDCRRYSVCRRWTQNGSKMQFWTAAGIQCAAGGLGMGLRCISALPPVFSVPPVDPEWVLDAFLHCRRYSVCRRWTRNGS